MAQPPEIRITSGSPTPEQEAAARAAILELWRQDQARAAREAPSNAWALSGRIEATRTGTGALRARSAPSAWRRSGRFSTAESHITIGRGDAK